MIVFKCPRCKEQMEAPTSLANDTIECPRCDNTCIVPALAAPPVIAAQQYHQPLPVPTRVQTVEQTAKTFKAWMLIGGLIFMVSPLAWLVGVANGVGIIGFIGTALIAATGLFILAIARMLAWWNHG